MAEKTVKTEEVKEKAMPKIKKVEFVPVVGKVFNEVYEDNRTKKDVVRTVMELVHPFDEFEEPIRITIKQNSRRGKYEYLARKELAASGKEDFEIVGTVKLYPFNDKKRRENGEYAGIEIEDRFNGGMLYCYIRDEAVRGAFTMLAKERLLLSKPVKEE